MRTSGVSSRKQQSLFRQSLDGYISSLELEEPMLFTVLNWICDNLPSFIDCQDNGTGEFVIENSLFGVVLLLPRGNNSFPIL